MEVRQVYNLFASLVYNILVKNIFVRDQFQGILGIQLPVIEQKNYKIQK